jgi:phenylacetate-coenzyme A ligase PaaK-like adenylate-forming protein
MLNNDKVLQNQLKNMLLYIKNNIEYYANNIPENVSTLNVESIQNIFCGLPLVKKIDMRSNMKAFISKNIASCPTIDEAINSHNVRFDQEGTFDLNSTVVFSEHTSGTSGIPFTLNSQILLGLH